MICMTYGSVTKIIIKILIPNTFSQVEKEFKLNGRFDFHR